MRMLSAAAKPMQIQRVNRGRSSVVQVVDKSPMQEVAE